MTWLLTVSGRTFGDKSNTVREIAKSNAKGNPRSTLPQQKHEKRCGLRKNVRTIALHSCWYLKECVHPPPASRPLSGRIYGCRSAGRCLSSAGKDWCTAVSGSWPHFFWNNSANLFRIFDSARSAVKYVMPPQTQQSCIVFMAVCIDAPVNRVL